MMQNVNMYNNFYWFFTCIWKEILSASIFSSESANNILSWWQSFCNWWRLAFLIFMSKSYKCCIMIELISVKELILQKVITVKKVLSANHGFLIIGLNFKILFVLLVVISRFDIIDIITVKDIDYCCIIHDISKSEVIHLLEKLLLNDCG